MHITVILTQIVCKLQSPFQGKSVQSEAIFATPPDSYFWASKINLLEWENPEILKNLLNSQINQLQTYFVNPGTKMLSYSYP